MSLFADFSMTSINVLTTLFVFAIGIVFLIVVAMFVIDVSQTADAVRRNYPVIGRFRRLFTTLGEYFRQYFFAMDRDEMPFNRAERDWVYKSSRGVDNTSAFGSTKSLTAPGTVIFVNCPFPKIDEDSEPAPALTIGPFARQPYVAQSVINISGMSFGAISQPAVQALSKGAALARCWLNTGEGGLAPYHLEGGCDIVFQIGTAKYGVRDGQGNLSADRLRELAAHEQLRMFELKLSQGAKPGKGGILPAAKVTDEIAGIRGIPVHTDSISPNRHLDIDSVIDLLDVIGRIREIAGKPVGFKTVVGAYGWIESLCKEVHARGIESAPRFHHGRFRRWRHRGGSDAADGQCRHADQGGAAGRRRYSRALRAARAHQGDRVGQADYAGRSRMGVLRRRRLRGVGAGLHVRARPAFNRSSATKTHAPPGSPPTTGACSAGSIRKRSRCGSRTLSRNCATAPGSSAIPAGSPIRALSKRYHCRIALGDGKSMPLDERYPVPETYPKYASLGDS